MRQTIKTALAVVVLTMSFAGSGAAGPYEDGLAAYESGDYATAMRLMRPLADKGSAGAQEMLGILYSGAARGVPQDYVQSVKWFRLAAQQGNVHASGVLCLYGHDGSVTQDFADTAKWCRLAAEQGDIVSQNNLGIMYDNGRGVPQDYAQAVKWYRLAAEKGEAYAQHNLGNMYRDGKSVPQDYVQAHKWYNLAASRLSEKQSRDSAFESRDLLAAKMTPAQIAEAQKLAREWKPK